MEPENPPLFKEGDKVQPNDNRKKYDELRFEVAKVEWHDKLNSYLVSSPFGLRFLESELEYQPNDNTANEGENE